MTCTNIVMYTVVMKRFAVTMTRSSQLIFNITLPYCDHKAFYIIIYTLKSSHAFVVTLNTSANLL